MEDNNNQQIDEQVDDTGTEEQQADPVRNVQAEMNRKLENQNALIAQQAQQLEAIMATIRHGVQPPAQQTQTINYKEAIFDNPDAVVADMVKKATAAADERVEQRIQAGMATQNVVNELSAKYSEFAQPNSPAAQLAVKKANALPASIRNTPEGVRLAMMDAVADLGLVPASRRQNTDDFTIGAQGTGNRGSSQTRRTPDPKKDIDPRTLEMAALLGVDTSDPKRLEGLKKASQRKRWNGYE